MKRKRFKVSFTVTIDDDPYCQPPMVKTLRDFVHELEWVGGCRHPDDPFHSNKNISVAAVRVSIADRKRKTKP